MQRSNAVEEIKKEWTAAVRSEQKHEEIHGGESTGPLPLKYLVQAIWRRVWIVVVVAALLSGIALGFSFVQTPMYAASVEILVGQQSTDEISLTPYDLQQLTQTLVGTIHSRRVAEGVIQELNLQTSPKYLLQNMSVEQVNATQLIYVEYRDPNPQRAQAVADTVPKVFSKQMSEVSPSAASIITPVWEHATFPERPVTPKPERNVAIALGVGVMLGIALVLLLDYLNYK
jgi:capsular polysaccharide biosynthesis protein